MMKIKKSKDNPEQPDYNKPGTRKIKYKSRIRLESENDQLLLNTEEHLIPLKGSSEELVKGDVEFDGKATLVNCLDVPEEQDIATLKYLKHTMEGLEEELLSKSGGTISGNWFLDEHRISDLKTIDNYDSLVNLETLNHFFGKKLNFGTEGSELSVYKNFKFNEASYLKGLKNSRNPEDSLIVSVLEKITEEYLSDYIKTDDQDTTITSNLNMSENRITNLKIVESEQSAIHLKYAQEQTSHMITKTKDENPITTDLIFDDNTTISQLGNAKDPKDIMNLRNFLLLCEQENAPYVPLKSASVHGHLSISGNFVSGLQSNNAPGNAVSVAKLRDTLNSHLSYSSKDNLKIFLGHVVFDGNSKVKGVDDPVHELDAVNLKTANSSLIDRTQDLVKKREGILENGLDCREYGIYELSNPEESTDGVNLQTMIKEVNEQKIVGMLNHEISLEENLHMNLNEVTNISPEPKNSTDGICSLSARNIIKQKFLTHLSSSNNKLQGPLDINHNKISDTQPGTNNGDSVNLSQLNTFSENYLSIRGNESLKPVKNNLYLSASSRLVMEKEAIDPSEAVNLKTAQKTEKLFLSSQSSDIIEGDLIFNDHSYISGLSDPVEETDAVNHGKIKTIVSQAVLNLLDVNKPQITGNLAVSEQGIINLANPRQPSEAVNLSTLKTILASKVPLTGFSGNQGLERNFDFKNSYKIKGITNAETDYEAVNLGSLKQITSNYVSKLPSSDPMAVENLYFDGIHGLKGIKSPEQSNELLNLKSLQILVTEKLQNILSGNEASITGVLDLNGNTISGQLTPKNNEDTANLESLKTAFDNCVSLLTQDKNYIKKTWKLEEGFKISGFADPVYPSDAVNFRTLNELKKNILTVHGNSESSPIKINFDIMGDRFENMGESHEDYDGISTATIHREISKLDLVPVKKTENKPVNFSGELNMNSHSLTSLARALNPSDMCNLSNLKSLLTSFIKLKDNGAGKISGNWNLNNHKILNVVNPKEPEDLVNLTTLNTSLNTCIHLNKPNPLITKNISFGKQYGLSGLNPATLAKQIATLANFKLEASNLKTKFLNRSNNRLTGHVDMQQHRLSSSETAVDNGDGLSLKQFKTILESLIPLESEQTHVITGSIFCNGISKPMGMRDPIKNSDALTLGYMKNKENLGFITSNTQALEKLDLNKHMIINHGDAIDNEDLVNLKILQKNFSLFQSSKNSRNLNYDLALSGRVIRGGAQCSSLEEALHRADLRDTLKGAFHDCLPTEGGVLSVGINMNGFTAAQGVPLSSKDALTLGELKQRLENLYNPFVSLKGDVIIGDLNLNGNAIILENDDTHNNESDGFSLRYALNASDQSLADYPLKFDAANMEIGVSIRLNGSINLNNQHLKSRQESKESKTALNLKLLEAWFQEVNNVFLPKNGGRLLNGLDMNFHRISDIAEGVDPNDGINMQQMENYGSTYLSLQGTNTINPVRGDLTFDRTSTLKNIKNALENDHLVNMITLKANAKEFFKQFSTNDMPSLQGNLYLETGHLKNLGNPESDNDLCNLETLLNYSDTYLKLSSQNPTVTANFILETTKGIKNLNDPLNDEQLINLKTLRNIIEQYETTLYDKNTLIPNEALNMNGYTLKISNDNQENNEAISLSEFQKNINTMTQKIQNKTSPWKEHLDMGGNRINNLGDPLTPGSLVNLKTLKSLLKTLINQSSSTLVMKGDILINSPSSLEIKQSAFNDDEALNIKGLDQILSSLTQNYLSKDNPRFSNTIDMKNHNLTAEKGSDNEDAVIYQQVVQEINKSFVCSSEAPVMESVWQMGLGLPIEGVSLGTANMPYDTSHGFTFSEVGIYFLNFCITGSNITSLAKISLILKSETSERTVLCGYLNSSKSLLISGTIAIESPSKLKIIHDHSSEIIVNRISYGIVQLATTV